jgi:hypothetical protein
MSVDSFIKRQEAVDLIRRNLLDGRLVLNNTVLSHIDEQEVYVAETAILLGGMDGLYVDASATYLSFFTRYSALTAKGINNTWFGLGGISCSHLNINDTNKLLHLIGGSGRFYDLEIGSIKDFSVVGLSVVDNEDVFNVTYKVEWDGETRVEV